MSYRSRLFFRYVFGPILIISLYYVIMLGGVALMYTLEGERYRSLNGELTLCVGVLGIIVMTAWILIKRRVILPGPRWALGQPCDWGFAVVGALAMLGLSMLYLLAVDHIPFQPIVESMKDYTETMNDAVPASRSDLYRYVFATCFFIPVMEEMMFRGCIMEGMLELNRPYIAVALSSFYFAVMHGQPIQIGYAFLAGLILGLIYYYTKNICMTILAHVIFNLLGGCIQMLIEIPSLLTDVIFWIEVVAIAGFVATAVPMARKREKRFPVEAKETGDINKMLPGRHT